MNKYVHTVASFGFLFTLNYDARNDELKKIVKLLNYSLIIDSLKNARAVVRCISITAVGLCITQQQQKLLHIFVY